MSQKTSRLARKRRRLEMTDTEREFTSAMNSLRAQRDAANAEANRIYKSKHDELVKARHQARGEIEAEYNSQRSALIEKFAAKEEVAAA